MKEFKPPYYKLITIDGYRYVVDGDIKAGDKVRINAPNIDSHLEERTIHKLYTNPFDGSLMYMLNDTGAYLKPEECFKPIASNNPNLPDLPSLPEPDGQEDSIQKLLNKWKYSLVISRDDIYHTACERIIKDLEELIAAKGKGTYSEDDISKAMYHIAGIAAGNAYLKSTTISDTYREIEKYLKSLKPEPIGVELDMESGISIFRRTGDVEISQPKVGMENGKDSVIVKRWIYE